MLSLLLLSLALCARTQQCHDMDGNVFDIGETECIIVGSFNQRQRATCSTDEFVMRVTNGRYICPQHGLCWYHCMLQMYDINQGPAVYNACLCSSGETPTEAPTDNLPPHCYSPRGDDCSWYRECLELRYQCEGTDDGYGIEYAEKFCNLYSNNYNDFSTNGRDWVDGVRKCLQGALVPSLRPSVMKTCEDIRRDAFNSHPGCYLTPGTGIPGICELSCADVWSAFWLVNFEGGALSSAPIETGKQMLSVMAGCFNSGPLSGCIPAAQTALLLTVIPGGLVTRLSILAAAQIVNYIAEEQDWNENGFRWFPFLDDNDNSETGNRKKRQTANEYANINVLLIDTKALNISNGTTSTQTRGQIDLDQVVEDLANAVSNGLLSEIPLLFNGTQMSLEVFSVGQCTDILCNSTNVTELATASSPLPTSSSTDATEVTTATSTSSSADATELAHGSPTSGTKMSFLQLHNVGVICAIHLSVEFWG